MHKLSWPRENTWINQVKVCGGVLLFSFVLQCRIMIYKPWLLELPLFIQSTTFTHNTKRKKGKERKQGKEGKKNTWRSRTISQASLSLLSFIRMFYVNNNGLGSIILSTMKIHSICIYMFGYWQAHIMIQCWGSRSTWRKYSASWKVGSIALSRQND